MADQSTEHSTAGRRRRYKSPPVLHDTAALPVPRLADHLDTEDVLSDGDGEKEAKRQRSEPTTPISTSSRLPHEYDEVMGITQVDPREAERFEEGLDLEYHDASEDPPRQNESETGASHGGCGSSSLRECIELLNTNIRNAPATLHSGIESREFTDPQQVMSPNVENSQTAADAQASGFAPSDTSPVKDEPQSRDDQVKTEVVAPKVKPPALDVKEELSDTEVKEENTSDPVREETQEDVENAPPHDSEDSLDPERVGMVLLMSLDDSLNYRHQW